MGRAARDQHVLVIEDLSAGGHRFDRFDDRLGRGKLALSIFTARYVALDRLDDHRRAATQNA